jgi:hypothetical protein
MSNILVGTVSATALVMGLAVGGCDTFSGSNTPRGGTTGGDTTRSDTNRGGTTGSGIGGTTGGGSGGMEGGRTGSGS